MKVTRSIGFIPQDTTITLGDPVFIDIKNPQTPFTVHGVSDGYRRAPAAVCEATSDAVKMLGSYSTGVRVRFRTDSDYIVLHAKVNDPDGSGVFSGVVRFAFDMYSRDGGETKLCGVFVPSQGPDKDYIESRLRVEPKMRDYIIHFPLFCQVSEVAIALREGCELLPPEPYKYTTPVVFYGSSIVNGVGASHPFNTYPAIVSDMLDTDYINLGFSGAARAEEAIMNYISGLKMSVFVYDYDYNAPTPEYLEKTHYAGYKIFRAAQPTTPVIFASKPDYHHAQVEVNEHRRQIVIATYKRALAEGDENVAFVDGSLMYPAEERMYATFDGCHPNDYGYLCMARAFAVPLRKFIENNR